MSREWEAIEKQWDANKQQMSREWEAIKEQMSSTWEANKQQMKNKWAGSQCGQQIYSTLKLTALCWIG